MMKEELKRNSKCLGGAALSIAALLIQMATMVPAFADEVIFEQTQVSSTKPKSPNWSMPPLTTTLDKDELASLSQRLQAMRDQIDMGAQKQWLTASDADALRTKADALTTQTDDLRTTYNKDQAEEVEKQANELNVAISGAMKNAPATAPVTTSEQ
jgi:hypothetical protein